MTQDNHFLAVLNEVKKIADEELKGVEYRFSQGNEAFSSGSDYINYEFGMGDLQQNFRLYFFYNGDTIDVSINAAIGCNTFEIADPKCFEKVRQCIKPLIMKLIDDEDKKLEEIIMKRRMIFKGLRS